MFLQGCGLPQAWSGLAQWRVLETGFGLGLNFVATWQAWKDDAQRPALLHFVSIEAHPVGAADLLRSAQAHAVLSARRYVTPGDVQAVAVASLSHRLIAEGSGGEGPVLVGRVIADTPAPTT